ncbi:hypothetical protein [Sphingomonas sp. Leaf242]|uniref:hypothetical protein n=1 Tax=Sphingomonas sp. Leaf242 TaxID=1736304 RepID=UPI000712E7B3|nr:hypothetical protein [Sphingomonas sp. Leaf242]KQO12476.1 hypothetical protein ASF09_19020 [Sphingomonas sp. Leaf242]
MSDNPLVDAIENILLVPSSDFYIAKILYSDSGNALDPRTVDSFTLGGLQVLGMTLDVTVRQFGIHGLSNVEVKTLPNGQPAVSVDGDAVTFDAQLPNTNPQYQRPADVPNQVQAGGALNVTINSAPMPPGTIAMTIDAVQSLSGTFTVTEAVDGDLNTLSVDFTNLTITPDLSNNNMTITVNLPTAFNGAINTVLNQPGNQQQLIEQVNAYVNRPDVLDQVSQIATQQAKAALLGAQ